MDPVQELWAASPCLWPSKTRFQAAFQENGAETDGNLAGGDRDPAHGR